TGAAIALCGHERGHKVTLITSHPEAVDSLRQVHTPVGERWTTLRYRTFNDLQESMTSLILGEDLDVIIHCAAVSDYRPVGIYATASGTHFDVDKAEWHGPEGMPPALEDKAAGKVKSDEPELWMRLVRTPKLIDRIRTDWNFQGLLVKF